MAKNNTITALTTAELAGLFAVKTKNLQNLSNKLSVLLEKHDMATFDAAYQNSSTMSDAELVERLKETMHDISTTVDLMLCMVG